MMQVGMDLRNWLGNKRPAFLSYEEAKKVVVHMVERERGMCEGQC